MSVELDSVEEALAGQLTGHRVRFDGMSGRAGTFNRELGQYTVTMDEGFSRTVQVAEKYLEDLGAYESPIEKVTPDVFRRVPCTNAQEGETEHTALVLMKSPAQKAECLPCQTARYHKLNKEISD